MLGSSGKGYTPHIIQAFLPHLGPHRGALEGLSEHCFAVPCGVRLGASRVLLKAASRGVTDLRASRGGALHSLLGANVDRDPNLALVFRREPAHDV